MSIGKKKKWNLPARALNEEERKILIDLVPFYKGLNNDEKKQFEFEIMEFLANCKITGVNTEIDATDKILIAASGIIPIFAFPEWKYYNLKEVLVYPKSFNRNFETSGKDRTILGMVGTGYMEGKMILSKNSLRHGFKNKTDKRNTAIHEFIHLIDKMDGEIDGVPNVLLENQYVLPWFDLIDKKIKEIASGKTNINPYAATSRVEFFSVLGEYFFEKPKFLKRKHPVLYDYLVEIFDQDMAERDLK